uniref:Uncharacterized protein n=1 Tax=Arundo donax TaxID=35708 RepID=A0A0A9A968_ARUDO
MYTTFRIFNSEWVAMSHLGLKESLLVSNITFRTSNSEGEAISHLDLKEALLVRMFPAYGEPTEMLRDSAKDALG